jgi:hypothetical protein
MEVPVAEANRLRFQTYLVPHPKKGNVRRVVCPHCNQDMLYDNFKHRHQELHRYRIVVLNTPPDRRTPYLDADGSGTIVMLF